MCLCDSLSFYMSPCLFMCLYGFILVSVSFCVYSFVWVFLRLFFLFLRVSLCFYISFSVSVCLFMSQYGLLLVCVFFLCVYLAFLGEVSVCLRIFLSVCVSLYLQWPVFAGVFSHRHELVIELNIIVRRRLSSIFRQANAYVKVGIFDVSGVWSGDMWLTCLLKCQIHDIPALSFLTDFSFTERSCYRGQALNEKRK